MEDDQLSSFQDYQLVKVSRGFSYCPRFWDLSQSITNHDISSIFRILKLLSTAEHSGQLLNANSGPRALEFFPVADMRPKVRGLLGPLCDYLSRDSTWHRMIVEEIEVMALGLKSAIFMIQPFGIVLEVGVLMASGHAICCHCFVFFYLCGIMSRQQ